jgi:hypothetical protein
VVERVTKIEMTFFIAVEGESQTVRGGWLEAVVLIQSLVLTQEGGQRDEALPKDKMEVASSSWLHGKKA